MGYLCRFKPCYKWITFNTGTMLNVYTNGNSVLNLVINGLPSILADETGKTLKVARF